MKESNSCTSKISIDYIRTGDYLIPSLTLPEAPAHPLGKYARMRERYLKEYHPAVYNVLLLSGKLLPHLQEIDAAARQRLDALMPQMIASAGATEELKAADPLRWVGLMNALKAQAEEMTLTELVYPEEVGTD